MNEGDEDNGDDDRDDDDALKIKWQRILTASAAIAVIRRRPGPNLRPEPAGRRDLRAQGSDRVIRCHERRKTSC